MLITPEIARKLLKKNTVNRPLRKGHVAKLATKMILGRWREDIAPSIILGKHGVIIDGQHRLAAIIESGIPTNTDIKHTNDESAKLVDIDSGLARSASDLLQMRPCDAAVVRLAGQIIFNSSKANGILSEKVSIAQLERWAGVVGDISIRLTDASGKRKRTLSTAGVRLGFCLAALGVAGNAEESDVFIEYSRMKDAYLEEVSISSIRALYRYLMNRSLEGSGGGHLSAVLGAFLTVRAFESPNLKRMNVRMIFTEQQAYIADMLLLAEAGM